MSIKELKDAYFAGLTSRKVEGPAAPARDVAVPFKVKPLKKKVNDDPFVSDDDGCDQDGEVTVVTKVIGQAQQDNAGHESAEEEMKRKEALQAKKKAITGKRAETISEDDRSEEIKKSNKPNKGSAARRHVVEPEDESSDAEVERKKQPKAKKTAPKVKRAKISDDEEDERPMKRRATRKNLGV